MLSLLMGVRIRRNQEAFMSTFHRYPKRDSPVPGLSLKIVCILFMLVPSMGSSMTRAHASELLPESADQEMARGKNLLTQGAFAESAVHLKEAAGVYQHTGNDKKQSQALTYLAYALQHDGQIRQADKHLQDALKLSMPLGDHALTASILGQMGTTKLALGDGSAAVARLREALKIVREVQTQALEAAFLNDLGNALTLTSQRTEAIDVFLQSRTLAQRTSQPALALTALINRGMTYLEIKNFDLARQQFDQASQEIEALSDSFAKTYGYLNIGVGYADLRPAVKPAPKTPSASFTAAHGSPSRAPSVSSGSFPPTSLARNAHDAFLGAINVATRLGDVRAEAYARGHIGALLEKEQRYHEALTWTREAVFSAQKVNATDSLYRWHWQLARLLKATGNIEGAQAAYDRAMTVFQPLRREVLSGYQHRHHSFKDSVAPLFVEFHDSFLRRAAQSQDPREVQELLVKVRNAAELSRLAELQDYFRDECVDNARVMYARTKTIPEHTAVIYPIILPDRLELLMQTAENRLQRIAVAVDAETLIQNVNDFRDGIRNTSSTYYREIAQDLYGWLLEPLRPHLAALAIHTLVFVPDGPLRAIPMAALYDGKQFAIETYAIAVTPSMELTDTRSVDLSKANMLLMGLTEGRGQEFPPLPNVATEVGILKTLYDGTLLLDDQFLVPSIEQELNSREVSIIHFATHGKLEEEVSKSFLLTYQTDEQISMNRLSELVGLLRHRLVPLELLTLSACDTAVGDERAALGLAGVAVKAGARSALATLWPVSDKTTSELIVEFYRQLRDESVSKADALKRAQLKIKSAAPYDHPYYWAPFLLISNWR
jgi:CHAT domain-containing protein